MRLMARSVWASGAPFDQSLAKARPVLYFNPSDETPNQATKTVSARWRAARAIRHF
jgi:hypothetical protein